MKESIIIHFRAMEIKRKYKESYKDKYRDQHFYDSDRSYDMDNSHSRDRSYSRDRSQDYCRDVYKKENHKYKRRSRDYYEDAYEDRHDRDKYKHQYRNESYNLGRDRSREKQHECNARKTPYFSKLELVDNTIRKLDPNKVITERFLKAVTEDIDDLFDNTCSLAEVRCWLAKKYMQVKDQKAENEIPQKTPMSMSPAMKVHKIMSS